MEERVFLVMMYFLSNRDLNKMCTEFGKCFNEHSRKWPAKIVIQSLVWKFETTGSVLDDWKRTSVRAHYNCCILGRKGGEPAGRKGECLSYF